MLNPKSIQVISSFVHSCSKNKEGVSLLIIYLVMYKYPIKILMVIFILWIEFKSHLVFGFDVVLGKEILL